jgi:hypothetical protein
LSNSSQLELNENDLGDEEFKKVAAVKSVEVLKFVNNKVQSLETLDALVSSLSLPERVRGFKKSRLVRKPSHTGRWLQGQNVGNASQYGGKHILARQNNLARYRVSTRALADQSC